MGLLDENTIVEALRNFSGLLAAAPSAAKRAAIGLLNYAEQNRSGARDQFNQAGITLGGKPVTAEDVDMAMAAVSMAPLGITAWHGSPHKFDKFDMSKIGTGEGAQAYGHGLYFAESPEVAKQYALDVKPKDASQFFAPRSNATQSAIDYFKAMQKGEVPRDVINGKAVSDDHIADQISRLTDELPSLYKTDIPDEAVARFLDWDKPLSQQAPEVQKVLKDMPNYEGSQLHSMLIHKFGSQDAVNAYLKQQGIPGIRYLDGGSRSAGQGSSNFVVFDPEIIRILERNGQPTGLQPWNPGEWKGLLR